MTTSLSQRIAIVFLTCLSFAGCGKLAYQHMNDPSRDAWQQPMEVVDRLPLKRGDRVADHFQMFAPSGAPRTTGRPAVATSSAGS